MDDIVLATQIAAVVLLGDAPSPSGPATATPLSVPVGVPPGLEYLTQVILLSFLLIITFLLPWVH